MHTIFVLDIIFIYKPVNYYVHVYCKFMNKWSKIYFKLDITEKKLFLEIFEKALIFYQMQFINLGKVGIFFLWYHFVTYVYQRLSVS